MPKYRHYRYWHHCYWYRYLELVSVCNDTSRDMSRPPHGHLIPMPAETLFSKAGELYLQGGIGLNQSM